MNPYSLIDNQSNLKFNLFDFIFYMGKSEFYFFIIYSSRVHLIRSVR